MLALKSLQEPGYKIYLKIFLLLFILLLLLFFLDIYFYSFFSLSFTDYYIYHSLPDALWCLFAAFNPLQEKQVHLFFLTEFKLLSNTASCCTVSKITCSFFFEYYFRSSAEWLCRGFLKISQFAKRITKSLSTYNFLTTTFKTSRPFPGPELFLASTVVPLQPFCLSGKFRLFSTNTPSLYR